MVESIVAYGLSIRLFASIFIFCFSLTTWNASGHAKDLKIGLGELDYFPFYFQKNGVMQGAAVEIAQHIANKLGHTFVFKRHPWKRVQLYLKNGKIDMMILYFKTSERKKDVIYTDLPHINESSSLFVATGAKITSSGSLKNLQSYSFGNVRGYSHGKTYDNADYLSKQIVKNEISLIRMVARGRIDFGVGNKPVILEYARREGLHTKITFITPPIDDGENYFAFSRARNDAAELAANFSIEVEKFKGTEGYRKILLKYGFAIPE